MSQYALRMPDSLFKAAKGCAEFDHVSMNQFFVTAIAEKISALTTEQFFKDRGALSPDRDSYIKMLASAPDVVPACGDELQ
jgi:hypothetical protein